MDRHRDDFLALLEGPVDLLFANEQEILSLYEVDDFDDALQQVLHHCEIAALTRGPKGSVVVSADDVHVIDAHPVDGAVVDTTGAGDLYAAGFLYGLTHGYDLGRCGRLGALAASRGDLAHRRATRDHARRRGGGAARSDVRLPRYRSGDPQLDAAIADLVERAGPDLQNQDLVFELVASALRLARDRADRGDLKIANAALKEMRYAFHVFAPAS